MKNIIDILKNKYFKFGLISFLYILFIIWLHNYWYLLGLLIIFDLYISKKVNWTFWKKREEENSKFVEWVDALIFAVIAVTLINIFLFQNYKIPSGSMEKTLMIGDHLYVSKMAYGPRIPQTPLSFPFSQNTMPLAKKTKSYLEWIKLDYKRLKGFGKIKRDDIVVFNFPAGDTVVIQMSTTDYYGIVRGYMEQLKQLDTQNNSAIRSDDSYYSQARKYIWDNYDVVSRPVDRRDNYIKRCVAIAGDTLEMKDCQIFVNHTPQKYIENSQHMYMIKTSQAFNPKTFEKLEIASNDIKGTSSSMYQLLLTDAKVEKMKKFSNVIEIQRMVDPAGEYSSRVFPYDSTLHWNKDNFGPLYIPQKGKTINLSTKNLPIYKQIIDQYEHNDLVVNGNKIFINGEEVTTYTFKMDYYFMIGDNRHDSADSRFWGFVPEDHIVGKPKFIWLSKDDDKSFPKNIRLKRMFTRI